MTAVDEYEFAVHSSKRMTRRIVGITLTVLLAMTQTAPLLAAACSTKAMDCCDGVMCPIPKKHASASDNSMQHCAPGAMDESATTCKASPCAPKFSPAVHASMYVLPAAAGLTRKRIVASASQSFELISSAMSAVPDPPPPKIIFS
jgi:hypothetical protein